MANSTACAPHDPQPQGSQGETRDIQPARDTRRRVRRGVATALGRVGMVVAGQVLTAMALSGAAQAAPVRYEIDPTHTFPSFEADHMGLSVWRGKFNRSRGVVLLDREAKTGTLEVEIETDSIDFGLDAMNEAAKKPEMFDVAKYPLAHFKGQLTGFYANGVPGQVQGTLTLHGVTQPLTLQIKHFKCAPHLMLRREVCGADAEARFQRDAFGIDAGKAYGFDMGVLLRIQIEAIAAER